MASGSSAALLQLLQLPLTSGAVTPCPAVAGPVLKGETSSPGFWAMQCFRMLRGRVLPRPSAGEHANVASAGEREVCSYLVSIGNCINKEMIEAVAPEVESSFGPAETAVNSHKLEASYHLKAALVWAVVIAP